MTTATYAEIQQRISGLQRQAEQLKAKELIGVIERIRNAIGQYHLTVEHIFGVNASEATGVKKRRGVASKFGAVKKRQSGDSAPSAVNVKFRDKRGNTWPGRGRRPDWLRLAIEDGASLADFAVKD